MMIEAVPAASEFKGRVKSSGRSTEIRISRI